jgi:hypothetical protein
MVVALQAEEVAVGWAESPQISISVICAEHPSFGKLFPVKSLGLCFRKHLCL